MVKRCENSIYKPLKLLFQCCLESETFRSEWTKNVVPVYKMGDNQILEKLPTSIITSYI